MDLPADVFYEIFVQDKATIVPAQSSKHLSSRCIVSVS